MKLEHLTNREPISVETVAAGETIENVQICPVGDFPNGGREQHCTLEALENVARQWKEAGEKEILVDFEHNSEAGGTSDTSAAAWVTNLRVDGELGLLPQEPAAPLPSNIQTFKHSNITKKFRTVISFERKHKINHDYKL